MMNSAAIKGQKERKIPVMEKIASFTIDHIKLKPGVYVSRKDHIGDSVITTFDLRMTSPNRIFRSNGLPYRILPAAGR